MAKTKIEWTEKTWNPVTGCTKVSAGCTNCYAESIAKRFWKGRKFTDIVMHEDRMQEPYKWRKPCKVFVNSMGDLFHEKVDYRFIDKVFMVMANSQSHTYQILTKRPERMYEYQNTWNWKLDNVWLGVSVENQATANERIPVLFKTPAAKRFLSIEPILEHIDIYKSIIGTTAKIIPDNFSWLKNRGIDWVIVGCESGAGKRECKVEWIDDIVEQCQSLNIPVFVKQINLNGKVIKDINLYPKNLQVREEPK